MGTLSPALQVWAARFRTSDQPTGRSAYRRAVDPAEVQNFAAQNYYATRNVPDQTANTSRSAVAWNRLISAPEQNGLGRRRGAFLSAACAALRADAPGTSAAGDASLNEARVASLGVLPFYISE